MLADLLILVLIGIVSASGTLGLGFWLLKVKIAEEQDAHLLIRERVEYVIHCERLRRIGYLFS